MTAAVSEGGHSSSSDGDEEAERLCEVVVQHENVY